MQSQLQWNDRDIDEDVWNDRVSALDMAAVANGYPWFARSHGFEATAGEGAHRTRILRPSWRPVLAGIVATALVLVGIAYGVVRTAQQGVERIQADVVSVVELETIESHAKLSDQDTVETVETVELLGDAAMAQVLVTQTLRGGVRQIREPRFYVHTGAGWKRTDPVASFWGPASALDTANLHFVFGARDRAQIEQIAPIAEALYAGLMRAFDQERTRSGPLAIEIVPRHVVSGAGYADGRVQITSPILFFPAFGMSSTDTLVGLLRNVMCEPMRADALQRSHFKPQWQPLVDSLDCKLVTEAILAHAPTAGVGPSDSVTGKPLFSIELEDLLDRKSGFTPQASIGVSPYVPVQEHALVVGSLIDYLVATYGPECLPRLLRGFQVYEDWETLAPAVFGITASQLEAAWHSNPREGP
jgi:hypothetical protein